MPVRVVRHDRALVALMHDPNGGIARDMTRRAIRVRNEAVLNATGRQVAGAQNPEGRGPKVQFGNLRSSIAFDTRVDDRGVFARVGTNVEYGYFLEVTGIRSRTGIRRYPFLGPALRAARL